MFNGIIKNVGVVKNIKKGKNYYILQIYSNLKIKKNELGSSISCCGACLSIEKIDGKNITFYLSKETLNKTIFKYIKKGDLINLEKSLIFGNRISGHFVQGHIDTIAIVKNISFLGKSWFINFKLNKKYIKNLVYKGSIAINGVSLTISKIYKNGFQVVVIPQTLKFTNLIKIKKNDVVNIEFDILAKYINNFVK